MPSSAVLTTTDVGEFRATLRPTGRSLTITGRGSFAARHTNIFLHRLWMQRSRESLPRIWDLDVPPARTAILFHTEPGPTMGWRGAEVTANQVIPLCAGFRGWHTLSGAANWGAMSLPNRQLAEVSAAVVGRDLTPSRDAVAMSVPPHALTRLRRLHAAAGQLAETAPGIIENADAARSLEQALVEAMLACLAATDLREDTAAQRRHAGIIRRFCAVAEQQAGQALYLPEVCAAVGVSERTLFLCCHEQLGVSPKRYLVLRRLHLARRNLRAADPGADSVTKIATRYGFWDLGRFAAYYRRVFGESPSRTLHMPV